MHVGSRDLHDLALRIRHVRPAAVEQRGQDIVQLRELLRRQVVSVAGARQTVSIDARSLLLQMTGRPAATASADQRQRVVVYRLPINQHYPTDTPLLVDSTWSVVACLRVAERRDPPHPGSAGPSLTGRWTHVPES